MKVKELIEELQDFNENAEVIFVFSHKKQLFYSKFDGIGYNQVLKDNKLQQNKELVMIDLDWGVWCIN